MATATVIRPTTPATAPATPAGYTAAEKVTAAVVIGSAGALTLGVFAWAAWVASQISIPL